MSYTSSVINKYGDMERVKSDIGTLNEILDRQGFSLLIDVIAENVGQCANRFEIDATERQNTIDSFVWELKSALEERL